MYEFFVIVFLAVITVFLWSIILQLKMLLSQRSKYIQFFLAFKFAYPSDSNSTRDMNHYGSTIVNIKNDNYPVSNDAFQTAIHDFLHDFKRKNNLEEPLWKFEITSVTKVKEWS